MLRAIPSISLLMVVMVFLGCANLSSIHRTHDFKEGSALIDVKQRAILAKEDSAKGLMMCAEPSPDAMSAYAAELAAKANLPETVAVEVAGAFQESSAFVGLRTQSIQLLRDGFYRLCEARMNNVIQDGQYELLMRRQQRITVALLAIEQLTGALKIPSVTINTEGTAEIARNVEDLVVQREEKDKEIAAKNMEMEAIDMNADGAQAKKDALSKEITELEKSRDVLVDGIRNGRSLVATGSATAVVHATGIPTNRADAHIQVIAEYVDRIVKYTQTDDFGQMCLIAMSQGASRELVNVCSEYLGSIVAQQEILIDIMKVYSMKMGEVKVENAQDIKSLLEALKLLSDLDAGGGFLGMSSAEVKNINLDALKVKTE